MSRILLLAAMALLCPAQQTPVAGVFRDAGGTLRILQGVPGGWVAPVAIPERVDSAGFNGRWMWYKVGGDLHVRDPRGGWAVASAPGGRAAAVFSDDGRLAGFVFPDAGLSAEWVSGAKALGELHPWLDDAASPLPPEQIGEGLYLLRREGAVFAWRAGADPALIPLAEAVSFQLFQRNGELETAVGATLALPQAAPGESSEVRFRLRNPTTAPILINRLSVDPGAFKIFDQFFPPRYLQPGGFADFAVRFSPPGAGAYSTTLHVNDLLVTLTASSDGAAVVEMELSSGWQTLRAGDTADLGAVERRTTLRRSMRVTPAGTASVSGDGFLLEPGVSPTEFTVVFSSDKPGMAAGTLDVGGRLFHLRVTVTDFPTPRPVIVLSAEPKTAQESRLTVRLSEPARTAYTAAVTLVFEPDPGLPDDASVAFLPQVVRTLPVHFEVGESESQEIVFQTGTTAGRITLAVALGPYSEEKVVRVLPEPAAITAARATSASAAAEVVLTGFDTTRTVAKVSFTFYLKNGEAAAPGRIDTDVSPSFASYFKTISGSAFSLRANFPVSGTYSELEGVEVEITNTAGVSRTGRLRFE